MWAACAITRPSASNTAQEASRRSLMLGEYAARMSVIPISSAVGQQEPLQHLDRHQVHAAHGGSTAITRLPSASTAAVWPGSTTVVQSICSITAGPVIDCPAARRRRSSTRRLDEPLGRLEVHRPCAAEGLAGFERPGDGRTRDRERRGHPERHQLGRLLGRRVAERPPVRLMEAASEIERVSPGGRPGPPARGSGARSASRSTGRARSAPPAARRGAPTRRRATRGRRRSRPARPEWSGRSGAARCGSARCARRRRAGRARRARRGSAARARAECRAGEPPPPHAWGRRRRRPPA